MLDLILHSTITIEFDGLTVATQTSTPNGGFTTTFNVPLSSSIGDHTVKATQGSNSDSKTFTVTALVNPVILLDPASGPVGSSVEISGAGFAPNSIVTIKFNGSATTPATVTTTPQGLFSDNFYCPIACRNCHRPCYPRRQFSSKTFIVTSSLSATSLSNFRSIESRSNQSNATSTASPNNQSIASVPIVTNRSFGNTKSNGSIAPPLNTSSAQPTGNTLTAPSAKGMNNTSPIASTDNTINNNPSSSTLTQDNDTSNITIRHPPFCLTQHRGPLVHPVTITGTGFVLHVPSNLNLAGIAPLLCAGITTYSPMRHGA